MYKRVTYYKAAVDYLHRQYKDFRLKKVISFDQISFNENELCYFEDAEMFQHRNDRELQIFCNKYQVTFFSYVHKIFNKISNNTKIAILVYNRFLYNYLIREECQFTSYVLSGSVESIVEFRRQRGYAKREIIDPIFKDCSIVIMSKPNKYVSLVQKTKTGVYIEKVNIDKLDQYFTNENFRSLLPSKFPIQKLYIDSTFSLGQICTIRQGIGLGKLSKLKEVSDYSEKQNYDWQTLIFPVGIRNIQFPSISYDIVPLETPDSKHFSNWTLKENDLVVPLSGHHYYGAIVDKEDSRILVATNNIAILTPNKTVAPEYILAYLMTETFSEYLNVYSLPFGIRHIGVKLLQKAPLPCRVFEECTYSNKTLNKYKENIRKLKITENEMKNINDELTHFQRSFDRYKDYDNWKIII